MEKEIFEVEGVYKQLNKPSEGGVTGYFSRDFSEEDLEFLKRFFAQTSEPNVLNTRAWKGSQGFDYLITVASIEKKEEEREFEGKKIKIEWGEFSFTL